VGCSSYINIKKTLVGLQNVYSVHSHTVSDVVIILPDKNLHVV